MPNDIDSKEAFYGIYSFLPKKDSPAMLNPKNPCGL